MSGSPDPHDDDTVPGLDLAEEGRTTNKETLLS